MLDDLDLASITDEGTREVVGRLLNLIETLASDLREAQAEIQRLRDENNQLKGEQGKPSIKPGTTPTSMDSSSEPERRQSKPREKDRKVPLIQIDQEQILQVAGALAARCSV